MVAMARKELTIAILANLEKNYECSQAHISEYML